MGRMSALTTASLLFSMKTGSWSNRVTLAWTVFGPPNRGLPGNMYGQYSGFDGETLLFVSPNVRLKEGVVLQLGARLHQADDGLQNSRHHLLHTTATVGEK